MISFIVFFVSLTLQAQRLKVKGIQLAPTDKSALSQRRLDFNNVPCALVKIQLATAGAKFEGNVIYPVEYRNGEYWVYMTDGSRELHIKHPNYLPSEILFDDYGLQRGLKSASTYNIKVEPEIGSIADDGLRCLAMKIDPFYADVYIDGKQQTLKNGFVSTLLPMGQHYYRVQNSIYGTLLNSFLLENHKLTIPIKLPEMSAGINVFTDDDDTEVFINGFNMAQNSWSGALPSGICRLEGRKIGHNHSFFRLDTLLREHTIISILIPGIPKDRFYSDDDVVAIQVGDIYFNMVRVQGGRFLMGATEEQTDYAEDYEKPTREVSLSPFFIGDTEVTQELWEAVMGENPSEEKGPHLPVTNVSYYRCDNFISKLNEITGKKFRLPTEAEWEFAARGGNQSHHYRYSGSNEVDSVAWHIGNSDKMLHEVGLKKANEMGLYDMSGNVEEWCYDGLNSYQNALTDNPRIVYSPLHLQVVRGGSYAHYDSKGCRVSCRSGKSGTDKSKFLGFRLAL